MLFYIYPFDDISYFDAHYDHSANLLLLKRDKRNTDLYNYSHNLEYTHPLIFSSEYAYTLLRRNQSNDVKRATDILNTVLSFQDLDKSHETFALFPLTSEIISFDDFELNSIPRFCIIFLQILQHFSALLPQELINKLKNACYNIAFYFSLGRHNYSFAIQQARLSEIYMLLNCGRMFDNADFTNFGLTLFNDFYTGTLYNGGFWEYNVLHETYVNSELLSMIEQEISDPNYTNMVTSLYDLLWKNIAENFHSEMMLLTGPQSDISIDLPTEQFLFFIQTATRDNTSPIPNAQTPIISVCPQKYLLYFSSQAPNHFIQHVTSRGSTFGCFYNSRITTNYIQPNFTIGSFNCSEFWSSHIPLVGYLVADNKKQPYQFGLKVINNGHDFSSAKLNSVQYKGNILGHISFYTNRGDSHINLDPTNGIISTHDFRIRFYISGNIKNLKIANISNGLIIQYLNTVIRYRIPFINIDNIPVRFELEKHKDCLYFDIIIVSSETDYEINFLKAGIAACQFSLQVSNADENVDDSEYFMEEKYLVGILHAEDVELKLKTIFKPDYFEYINTNDIQFINNTRLEAYTVLVNSQINQYKFIVSSNRDSDFITFEGTDSILEELNNISKVNIANLHSYIAVILNKLKWQNYTLEIFKRYSVRIIKALFTTSTEKSNRFEDIINKNYFDIYQRISNSHSHDAVCAIVLETTDKLVNDYLYIKNKQMTQDIVSNVISIIEKNYQNPSLSLTEVSNMLGVSESYISRIFKKKTNSSYVRYLIKVRMEKAKSFLLKGMTAEETAVLCGYPNVSSFRRTFKQYTGITVTAWLHQNMF